MIPIRPLAAVLVSVALAGAAAAAAPASKPAAAKPAAAAHAKLDPAAEAALRKRALRDGWPDTPAGRVGYAYVEAFSAGEDAMRAFLAAHHSAESLAKRPMSERLARYRDLRERYGALALAKVEKSTAVELTASLLGDDARKHTFVFTVEKEAPHRLVSVGIQEWRNVPGHGHGGGGHGH